MESKSLISIVQESTKIESMLIETGGEITPEIESALMISQINLPEKVDSYALVMDRMDSISNFYKDKADLYIRLSKAASNIVDRCKDNLKFAMAEFQTDEIYGFDIRFKLTKSNPSCVIDDEKAVAGAYKITETITKIDKKKMLEDMKLGVPVMGAHLEQSASLRRYANTPGGKK